MSCVFVTGGCDLPSGAAVELSRRDTCAVQVLKISKMPAATTTGSGTRTDRFHHGTDGTRTAGSNASSESTIIRYRDVAAGEDLMCRRTDRAS